MTKNSTKVLHSPSPMGKWYSTLYHFPTNQPHTSPHAYGSLRKNAKTWLCDNRLMMNDNTSQAIVTCSSLHMPRSLIHINMSPANWCYPCYMRPWIYHCVFLINVRSKVLISLRSQVVSSKQPKLELTQELFFSRISESTTGYTFTPCVGSFTSPGIDTR